MFNLKQYFWNALYILRAYSIVVWSIVGIGIASGLGEMFLKGENYSFLMIIAAVFKLAIFAVVYGIYYQLIEDCYSSVVEIGKVYILPFIWLFLNMYVPALLFALLPGMLVPGLGGGGLWIVIMMFFGILYLYVIPWFYVSGSWRGSIFSGIQFLIKNLSGSTPIIMLALLFELAFVYLDIVLKRIESFGPVIYFSLRTGIFITEFFVNCIFFMVLVFVLKEAREEVSEI